MYISGPIFLGLVAEEGDRADLRPENAFDFDYLVDDAAGFSLAAVPVDRTA